MSGKGGRFWGGGSDSESESERSSDEEVDIKKDVKAMSRWVVESDSDSDDEVRVVKSTKERRFEGLDEVIQKLKNSLKVDDWNQITDLYTELQKSLIKVQKATGDSKAMPKQYLKTIALLEETANGISKSQQKTFSKTNSRSFSKMRQIIRKAVKENPLKTKLDEYKLNPGENR